MSNTTSTTEKTIGIIGGVGPYAGLDITQKIFANTVAKSDQEHLSVSLLSKPVKIADRSKHLLAPTDIENPGFAMGEIAVELHNMGASVIGIPCNTAHSPSILREVENHIASLTPTLKLINMISETFNALLAQYPHLKKIGLLATQGTYFSKVYEHMADTLGLTLLTPETAEQEKVVHEAIYNSDYGIKAVMPVTSKAQEAMKTISLSLHKRGAEAIIMGCTEIPLAMKEMSLPIPKIDPTEVLARSLIQYAAPHKLKPLS